MATRAQIRAEELVFEVAEELGLTEDEVLGLDALAMADCVVRDLRTELEKQAGRMLTREDLRPAEPPSPKIVDLGLSST